jgi:hypothetical protein
MKQLPGIFVLMSRKRKKDYKKVLQQILKLLPSPPVAERLAADLISKYLPILITLNIFNIYSFWKKINENTCKPSS